MPKPAKRSLFHNYADPEGVTDLRDAREIPVARLAPNPYQPRQTFDQAGVDELAASIRQHGVLQPLLVRPDPAREGYHQIAAGERRWRAAQLASLQTVPCIVRELDDDAMEEIALVENIQRDDLTPLDEARAYRRLMDRLELSMRALSERLGKSHTFVVDRLKLVSDPRIEAAVESGAVGATVAVEIADLEDVGARETFLARAGRGERLKVKDVQSARPHPQPAPVEDNLPPKPVGAGTATPLEDNLPPRSPRIPGTLSVAVAPPERPELPRDGMPHPWPSYGIAEQTTDDETMARDNQRGPLTRRPPGPNWVAATNMQTVTLFEVGEGYADLEQLRAALWADLEALDG